MQALRGSKQTILAEVSRNWHGSDSPLPRNHLSRRPASRNRAKNDPRRAAASKHSV